MLKSLKYIVNKSASSPIYLIHYVTSRCNAKCPHCFVPINDPEMAKTELSTKEIGKITQGFSGDILNVNLTGGEPFLRDDIVDIVRLYRNNANVLSFLIATNGFFTDKILESAKKILAIDKNIRLTINLSVDHIGTRHDELRGLTGLYNRTLSVYRDLSSMNTGGRLSRQINLTIQRENQDDLEEIINHLVFTEKVTNLSLSLVRGNSNDRTASTVNGENYFNGNKLLNEYASKGYIEGFEGGYLSLLNAKNQISRRVIEKTIKDRKFISTCFAGLLSGVLYSNGDVYPCELYAERIGNIRDVDYNFKALWDSTKAKEIRQRIVTDKCFCTHECFWTTNILYNARYAPELLCRFLASGIRKKGKRIKYG